MLKTINPALLGFNLKITNGSVNLAIPEIQIDFQNGQSNVTVLNTVVASLSVASNESLLVNSVLINANVALAGQIITYGTSISGTGEISGSGIIQ